MPDFGLGPGLTYWLFSLNGNALGNVLAKRAGMLFLGFAVLCFMARHATTPEVIRIVSASVATSMGAMALLGLFEFARGTEGYGIMLAIVVEVGIAAMFFRLLRRTH